MENEVMVSVYCLAYNHEKYIRDALEGFVNQKTNFRYEVFVHDDASTDRTAEIIAEYAARYPEIIKPLYEEENQYSQGREIVRNIIFPHMTGKYIASCEGDDYWCDENKLQKQFDFMEAHPDYAACVHNTMELNCRTGKKRVMYYQKEDSDLDFFSVIYSGGSAFHTSSVFCRREFFLVPEELSANGFGDYPMAVHLRLCGGIYRFKEIMSIYRLFADGSWTTRNLGKLPKEKLIRAQKNRAEFTEKVSCYCRKTHQEPEIQAAADDVAARDRLQLIVMQRGGRYLLRDAGLRKVFWDLPKEKKWCVLGTVVEGWMRAIQR